jgi:hypothetical protein
VIELDLDAWLGTVVEDPGDYTLARTTSDVRLEVPEASASPKRR